MRWNQTIASVHELALRDDEVALKNFLVILDQDIFTSHTSALYDTLVSPLYSYELVLLVIFQVDGPKHGLQNISDLTLFPRVVESLEAEGGNEGSFGLTLLIHATHRPEAYAVLRYRAYRTRRPRADRA